jgi:tetratricopeptide (TPR) repeat protein
MTHRPRRRLRLATLLLAAGLAAALAGCAPRAADAAAAPGAVRQDYERGRYREALAAAEQRLRRGAGDPIELRYYAGLSAYRLGQHERALDHLVRLVSHRNPAIAGSAAATAGLILAERQEDASAMRMFQEAASKLEGEDRARAYYHLALLEQQAGRWQQARSHLSLAKSYARDPDLLRSIRQRMEVSGFTLQFGAFGDSEAAGRRAAALRDVVRRAGLGQTRVVPGSTADGRTLYLVQAGQFRAQAEARRALSRLGVDEGIVVPVR